MNNTIIKMSLYPGIFILFNINTFYLTLINYDIYILFIFTLMEFNHNFFFFQGCMNNITFGDDRFGHYETVAGGAGAVSMD